MATGLTVGFGVGTGIGVGMGVDFIVAEGDGVTDCLAAPAELVGAWGDSVLQLAIINNINKPRPICLTINNSLEVLL